MFIIGFYPIQSLLFFLIAPTIGGYLGYNSLSVLREIEKRAEMRKSIGSHNNNSPARLKEELFDAKYAAMKKGISVGLLIDIPFLCLVLLFGSTM